MTSGAIFHKTRISLLKWYWLIYHMAMNKVGVSVVKMQRILEIGSYQTAWLMAHKIRKAMGDRDARYRLAGLVEMDESFLALTELLVDMEVKTSQPFCVPYRCIRTERAGAARVCTYGSRLRCLSGYH